MTQNLKRSLEGRYFPHVMADIAGWIINMYFQRNQYLCYGLQMLCTKRLSKTLSPEMSGTSKNIPAYPNLFFLLSLDSIDDCRASVTHQTIRMVPAEPRKYIKRFVSSQISNRQTQTKSCQTHRHKSQHDRFRMDITRSSDNVV